MGAMKGFAPAVECGGCRFSCEINMSKNDGTRGASSNRAQRVMRCPVLRAHREVKIGKCKFLVLEIGI